MSLLPYSYALAVGSGVALAGLTNIEDAIYPYTRPRRITVRSQPVNAFPVRTVLGSGRERGDGLLMHAWEFTAINQPAVDYLLTWIWAAGTVASTAVTIYTRRHDLGDYARYDAWAALPVPGQDMEYIRGGVLRMTIRFSGLEAL